jgi:hypothetical protein
MSEMSEDATKLWVTILNADGSNWVTYRDRMLWTIGLHNLIPHITHDTITPEYTAAGDVGILTPQQWWDLDQCIVKQLISTSVPDTVFNSIKSGTTAKNVWDELKTLYEGCTTLILVDLGRRLQTMHCTEEDSVHDHFEKLADLCEQLTVMGRSVPDVEFAQILMGLLPPLYAPTLSGIAAAAEISATSPTVASVKKLAVDEYDRCALNNGKVQDQAFAANAKKKGKKRNVECFNCHKRGHIKSDCWAKGGGKEGQGLKKRGSAKKDSAAGAEQSSDKAEDTEALTVIVNAEEEEEATPRVPAMAADEKGDAEAELYDSGASCHITIS